jgi:2-oxoisovalerate dehydrogenase E1 component alpha subunit
MAREYALKNNKPIVVEAMAYRISHHSTSDDSTAYRSADEVEIWNTVEHPISKLKLFMKNNGWWNESEEEAYVKSVRKQVLSQIALSEKKPKPDWREMFNDVYHDLPQHLK